MHVANTSSTQMEVALSAILSLIVGGLSIYSKQKQSKVMKIGNVGVIMVVVVIIIMYVASICDQLHKLYPFVEFYTKVYYLNLT